MITKREYNKALNTVLKYEQQLRKRRVIGNSSAGYQFMYYLSDEDYMKPEPKYRLKYVRAKNINEAVNKFLANKPKSLTRMDYEVEKDGKYIDISNFEKLQHYL